MTRPAAPPVRDFFWFEARMRTAIAIVVALAAYFALGLFTSTATRVIAAWDGFAVTLLALIWSAMLASGIGQIRERAKIQDVSRLVVFTFTIGAACLSMFAVVALLSAAKQSSHLALHVVLSVVAVLGSWTLVHTMFALRYAHIYYGEGDSTEKPLGGLDFPSDDSPNYLDFAYFSFVIGMTCQVSDVQVSSPEMRRLALIHGLISFLFNTAILAMFVNIVAGLVT
ncbi:MAG: DUF1345 domain-containing protein [Chthoniobacteraceae bacterium]